MQAHRFTREAHTSGIEVHRIDGVVVISCDGDRQDRAVYCHRLDGIPVGSLRFCHFAKDRHLKAVVNRRVD